jgi:hypothetical protein
MQSPAVIPAKAGIPLLLESLTAQGSWTPAFAGVMAKEGEAQR